MESLQTLYPDWRTGVVQECEEDWDEQGPMLADEVLEHVLSNYPDEQ